MHPWVATNLHQPAPTCTQPAPDLRVGLHLRTYHQYGFGKAPRYGWVVRCGCGKDLVPPNRATSPPPSVQLDSRNLHPVPRLPPVPSGMVFHGANFDPMFAAADANDQTLTPDVIDARGGEQLVTYVQCWRHYNSYRKRAEGDT